MGFTYVTAVMKVPGGQKEYEASFLVDKGAIDSFAPASELKKIGMKPAGKKIYEMADGSQREYDFGLVEISFMDGVTAGRVIFGPEGVEPLLGVTALESVGVVVDAENQTLRRLPAIRL